MRRSRTKQRKQCDLCSDTHSTLWRQHNNFLLCDSCFTLLQASKQKAERRAVQAKRNASNISHSNADSDDVEDEDDDDDDDDDRSSGTDNSDGSKEDSASNKARTPPEASRKVPCEDAPPPAHKKPRASWKSGSKDAAGTRDSEKNQEGVCQALWQLDTSYAHPLISALTHNATAKHIEQTLEKMAGSRQRHRKQSRPLRCDVALSSTNAQSADVAKSRRPWPTLRPFVSYRALVSSGTPQTHASNAIDGAASACRQRRNGPPVAVVGGVDASTAQRQTAAVQESDELTTSSSAGPGNRTAGEDNERAAAAGTNGAGSRRSRPQHITQKHWKVFFGHDVFLGENYDLFSVGPSIRGVNASVCVDAIQEHLVQSGAEEDTA